MRKQRTKGFTLMEMLIVVAIIGILVAVAIPVFSGSLEAAREAVCTGNRRSLLSQLSIEKMLTDAESLEVVADTTEGREWVADAVRPSKGVIEVESDVVSCSKHGGTLSEKSFMEQFKGVQDAWIGVGSNDNFRESMYNNQYPDGWPKIRLNGRELYMQPYYDGKKKEHVLFANGNKELKKHWLADAIYDFDTSTWYMAPHARDYISIVGKTWADLQAAMADKKWTAVS